MSRNTTPIPEPDRALFMRYRRLNKDIEQLRKVLPESGIISALERVDLNALPLDQRRVAACALRDKADLETKEAKREALSIPAEQAAQRIPNANLRRIVRLYCLDGMGYRATIQSCAGACCKRTVERWLAILNGHAEGNADAAAGQGGTERQ